MALQQMINPTSESRVMSFVYLTVCLLFCLSDLCVSFCLGGHGKHFVVMLFVYIFSKFSSGSHFLNLSRELAVRLKMFINSQDLVSVL